LKPAALVALAIVGILLWAYFSRSPEPAATTCSAVSTPVSNSVPSLTETKNLPVAPPAVETNAIPPVPTPVASNQAEPVVAKPVAVKPPARGFDTIKVQGIFYRSTNPTAIINNQTVSVGTRFNGFEVMAINQTSVTLAFEGQQKVFKVK
jgi:type IV secretory pathway VirB10-like protein